MVLKIRDGGTVQRRACYLALAIGMDGERDVLGMWFKDTEGAKFWMQVLTELRDRGVRDILVCCVDGLEGFPEAIEAIFPTTTVQTCIVHLIRASLRYVPRRDYDAVVGDLRVIYTAIDADRALHALDAFEAKWGQKFPPVVKAWRDAWEHVIPFLAFPPEVRRVIYTTNAIEALNRQLRKAVKTKGHFPNEDAARKLIYLAIHNAVPQWTRPEGGRKRCWRSRSTSETGYPINPPTQLVGHPRLLLSCLLLRRWRLAVEAGREVSAGGVLLGRRGTGSRGRSVGVAGGAPIRQPGMANYRPPRLLLLGELSSAVSRSLTDGARSPRHLCLSSGSH